MQAHPLTTGWARHALPSTCAGLLTRLLRSSPNRGLFGTHKGCGEGHELSLLSKGSKSAIRALLFNCLWATQGSHREKGLRTIFAACCLPGYAFFPIFLPTHRVNNRHPYSPSNGCPSRVDELVKVAALMIKYENESGQARRGTLSSCIMVHLVLLRCAGASVPP